MKWFWMIAVCLILLTGVAVADDDAAKDDAAQGDGSQEPAAADETPAATDALKSDKEKTSYAIGVSIGRGLKRDGADVDAAQIGRGLIDALGGGKLLLSDEQVRDLIIAFQIGLRGNSRDAGNAGAPRDNAAFLEANKKKEGVVTLPSGLQYRVIKEGDGEKPKATDRVSVHYRGTLIDGTQFDSSLDSGKPAEFGVGDVIAGWTEALQLMKVGSKWELVIPAELGYGDNPRPGGKIQPGDALVFEVELLDIK